MSKFFALFCLACTVYSEPLAPALFNGMKWRLVGPFRAGRVVAVTGIASEPNTFYFGAVNGGIWKTTDAGVVWEPIFDGQPVGSIGAIAVAPSDPNTIYAGTGESDIRSDLASGDGVYKSTDAGKTWTNVGLRQSRQISRVWIDPANANHIYVAALGDPYRPSAERGVYESADGGTTWTKVLDEGPETGAADLALASDEPKVLLAAMWNAHRPPWSAYAPIAGPGSGIYLSKDGGRVWTPLTGHGLPDGDWGRAAVAIAPGMHGQRLYALIDAKQAGLYRSDDGGATWTCVNSDPRLTSRQWYFASLTVDPNNPDVVYVPNIALYRSKDGGRTFSILRGAPGGDDYHQIWVSPKDSSRMVLGTDQGTTISVDDGTTWSSWYNQPTAQFYHVVTDDASPYWIYGAQQDSGSATVASWTHHGKITSRDWNTSGDSESGYIALDPKNPDILYLSGTYGEVSRYNKRTQLSQNIAPWPMPGFSKEIAKRKYRDTWTPVLLFSPFDKRTLYLGTQYVMKTLDGGLHWEKISPDLTGASGEIQNDATPVTVANAKQRGYGTVFTIAPSPLRANLIWAGTDTGLIQLTTDGATWKNVTPPGLSDWSKISLLEASHFNPAVAYAAIDRSRLSDYKAYIYRTRDYGKTWQLVSKGIADEAFVRAVREDPKQKGLLFAGTERGVYVSFNDGDDWQPLQQNLPVTSVRDLAFHGDDLIIATHGRSFWVLDNITPLRQASAVETADTYLYKPAIAMRVDNDTFPGTPLPPEEPTAENPPNGLYIDYFLPSSATGEIKLEILDGSQKVLRHFSSTETTSREHKALPIAERWFPEPPHLEDSSGMHRFVWDLRCGSSGAAGEEEDEESVFQPAGPRVPPGFYTVRLTVGGRTYTQPLRVEMDPSNPATPSELAQQYSLSQKIFDETLRSRQAMAEIESVQKQLTDMRQKLGGDHAAAVKSIDGVLKRISEVLEGKNDDGLAEANTGLNAALRVVEGGDRTPPVQALELYKESSAGVKAGTESWKQLKAGALTELNAQLRQQRLQEVQISEIESEVYELMTR